ncbi:MAG: phage tail protein [Nitrospirales bacterium]|nr:MAG: phage tail protein [Nitrospirales bacterium]
MATANPLLNHKFVMEIDGISVASFSDVTIAGSDTAIAEYREGDESPTVRKLAGLNTYGNVTCKWGITDSMDLYNWRKEIEDGKIEDARKSMSIIVKNAAGEDKARFNFEKAWPTKYTAPTLSAKGNDVAIESLEICHEGMERVA